MRNKLLSVALLFGAWLLLTGFTPFTATPNSCPECPINGFEQLVFGDGKAISVHLLGEYPEFYLVERFGEFRLVPKSEVKSVERSHAPTPNPDFNKVDLIVTSTPSEFVVAGRLEEVQPGRLVKIKPWRATTDAVVIWHKVIKQIWRGTRLDFPAASPAPAAGTTPPATQVPAAKK